MDYVDSQLDKLTTCNTVCCYLGKTFSAKSAVSTRL